MNKTLIIGNLGRDAAVRETANGGKFLSLTIADSQYVKGENKAYWYDVICFNFNEKLVPYFKKGSSLTVIGNCISDIEVGSDGVTRCRRTITADSIDFTPGGKQQEQGEGQTTQNAQKETTTEISMYSSRKKKVEKTPEPAVAMVSASASDDDSEIPF